MQYSHPKLGILGGGQLGRMMLPYANHFHVEVSVLDPNPKASCAGLVPKFVVGDFMDYDAVYQFGQTVDTITIEIENVNVEALKQLQREGKTVYPKPEIIEIIQDKRLQKQFYKDHNIPTAAFHLINKKSDLESHVDFLPAFQKLGKGGYDGAGVKYMADHSAIQHAFEAPSLIEKAIDCEKEVGIIAARNESGQIELFPPVEMVFHPEHNLVDYLFGPANLGQETLMNANEIVVRLIEAFDFVGLLAVELFVTKEGEIVVNECAPRTHNSGHHTIHACAVSQFEQHLRSVLNLPLAKIHQHQPAAMINLLGADGETGDAVIYGLDEVLQIPGVHVVLYGKEKTRPHRKMGHATILGQSKDEIETKIDQVRRTIKIGI